MNNKIDQFSATNSNLVLRVDKNGIILYSNEADEPLLNVWGIGVGKKLPSNIRDLVQRVILRNIPEKMEVKVGERVYLTVFHPLYEEKCVCISGFDISDRKEIEEIVQESKAHEVANVELAEIIDVQTIQSLMEDFYKLTHIPIGLNDIKGNVLVSTGWQDICANFHRVHPETCKHCIESDTKLSAAFHKGETRLYKCKNNMWDIATPILVGNQHIGYVFSGQFFFEDEPLDYGLFRSQARKYGFNEEEYIAALEKVPRFSREAVDTGMAFLTKLANLLSHLSYSIIRLGQSLSERNSLLEALSESEEKYRNIVETANEGILIVDAEPKITYANKKLADMIGYTLEESIGRQIWDLLSEEFKSVIKLNMEKMWTGIDNSYESKLIKKDGSPLWVHINAKSLFGKNGEFIGSLGMLTDITKRKEAEQALENLETARKKEIHHRIKNNLQVISSLLDLQSEKFRDKMNIKDSEVLEAFRESQNRVVSMALIHEELHKGEGLDELNFSPYIEELADYLFSTYRLGNTDVSLNMDLEENILFDMDTAVPLGMIVNELVSNSLKYVFPGRDNGEIRIKLRREGKGDFINIREESKFEDCKSTNFILSISDNGMGIPENFDIENLDSLGLQLVTSLVEQLDGTLELKKSNGTEFTIRFVVAEKNNKTPASASNNYRESPKFLH